MQLIASPYQVVFEKYTERHYIKDFQGDYKKAWNVTLDAITKALERIHNLDDTKLIDHIHSKDGYGIYKHDFKVAGTKESAKSSGNRAVLFVNNHELKVHVLLVYNKNHLPKNKSETDWWQGIVYTYFPKFWSFSIKGC